MKIGRGSHFFQQNILLYLFSHVFLQQIMIISFASASTNNCKRCHGNKLNGNKMTQSANIDKISIANRHQEMGHKNNSFKRHSWEEVEIGDTLTQNDLVTQQYALLPYPPFGEEKIKEEELHYKTNSNAELEMAYRAITLENINHFLFKGSENFGNFFRIIVAGGGTGGITIFHAEQLNHTNAEVIYLDFSQTSMKIAQRRAKIRGLETIIWVQSWIEGITFLGLGTFQHSQSSGVLHHLKNPLKGLNILKDTLTENGGMEVMVYATYGRTAVYHMQKLLKVVNKGQRKITGELINANYLLSIIPLSNWFKNGNRIKDHKLGDVGVYDLLLHKRDISYSIPGLYTWILKAGLNFIDFVEFTTRSQLTIKYSVYDEVLYRNIIGMDITKQMSIAEIMRGNIIKHTFFTAKEKYTEAALDDPSNNIYIYGIPHGFRDTLLDNKNRRKVGNQTYFFAKILGTFIHSRSVESRLIPFDPEIGYKSQGGGMTFAWVLNEFNMFLVKRLLVSNKGKSLSSLYSEYKKEINSNVTNTKLFELTKEFYAAAKHTGLFLLKKRHVRLFPKTYCISFFRIQPA